MRNRDESEAARQDQALEHRVTTYAVTELAAKKAAAIGRVKDFMMSEDVRNEREGCLLIVDE